LKQKFHSDNGQAEEKRDTCDQSTVYVDKHGIKKYNKRKITELPWFALNMSFSMRVKFFGEVIYFDYEFLTGMFNCLSFQDIIDIALRAIEVDEYSLHMDVQLEIKPVSESVMTKKEIGLLMLDIGRIYCLF
jgi:hypothetical protein